jgi:hypothetical protein
LSVQVLCRCALPIAVAAVLVSCVPEEVVVYVDGTRLDEVPSTLDLRSDRPHTLYFKGSDFTPELVVLNSEEVEGKMKLSPSEVCVKPRYVGMKRELKMEVDQDVSTAPSAGDEGLGSTIDVEPRPDFRPESP